MASENNMNRIWIGIIGALTVVLAITVGAYNKLRAGDTLPPLDTTGKELAAEQRAALASAPTPIDEAMRVAAADIQAAGDLPGWEPPKVAEGASDAEKGRAHFATYTCNACHSLDGSRIVGPSFKGLYGSTREFADGTSGVADDAYLHESIVEPNAKVVATYPPVMVLPKQPSEQEVTELVAFIKSLADGATPAAEPTAEEPVPAAVEPAQVEAVEAAEAVAAGAVAEASPEPASPEPAADEEPAGAADLVAAGQAAYQQLTCFACHSTDGTQVVGPSFKGAWGTERKLTDGSTVVMDEAYVRHSIAQPMDQIVEGFAPAMVLPVQPTEEQVDALVAFIKSLGPEPAAAAEPEPSAEPELVVTPEPAAEPEADATTASDNATQG